MLMKNMSDYLVNGLIGEVVKLEEESVTVYFSQIQKTELLTFELFTR